GKHGLAFEVLDQEPQAPGGAINHYPRRKVVMTSPFELPGYGRSEATVLSKEQLVDLWLGALAANGIEVRCAEKVEDVRAVDVGMPAARGAVPPDAGAFDVVTAKGVRRARTALLCVGRRGSPRRLDVPGEDLPNVAYRVAEPEQYAGSRVLVVGGGDAAIEGAIAVAGAGAASVTLAYRQAAVARVREANRVAFEQATADGRVRFEGESQVVAIAPDAVTLRRGGTTWDVGNDFVIVQIGGVLPLEFLARIGVSVEKKFGTA
ncbi:MAG: NAD(P)-binding domain-containing protein, partial [Deltaproteobacteria bacterium]|nr:NAD(P)-binding domain-containing protein [Deltaproteobacteria bacterium]